jgi:Tfp pilus assembly protein PilX
MQNNQYGVKSQRGYLLYMALLMIVFTSLVSMNLVQIFVTSSYYTTNLLATAKATFLAESGLNDGTHQLSNPNLDLRAACIANLIPTGVLSTGNYQVTTTGPLFANLTTTPILLTTALPASANTDIIYVSSVAGFQPSGRIMIDREFINYSSINATGNIAFLAVTRAVDGSTLAAHAIGAAVSQYQCNLTSAGAYPSLNVGLLGGKRVLNQSMQLQYLWTGGNTTGGKFTLGVWNSPTSANTWNNASTTSATPVQNITSINMLSYSDGWAVGAARTFLRWNGNAWQSSQPTGVNNVTYQSVYCNASNDCHAVGANAGALSATTAMARYNGTTWTQATINNAANTNLLSVRCVQNTSNNCWAVGDNTAFLSSARFYQWNGTAWNGIAQTFTNSAYPYNSLYCSAANDCWAVGANYWFARLTTGTSWASINATTRGNIPNVVYSSVYCNATDDCWAVGAANAGRNTFAHWNGQVWARDPSVVTPAVTLNEVKCVSPNDCWAVGAVSGTQPVINHWDGTSWANYATTGFPNAPLTSLSVVYGTSTEPWGNWSESKT